MLPTEIEEAKTEREVFTLLKKCNFSTTKGHFDQTIYNHSQGKWAGANGQFDLLLKGFGKGFIQRGHIHVYSLFRYHFTIVVAYYLLTRLKTKT